MKLQWLRFGRKDKEARYVFVRFTCAPCGHGPQVHWSLRGAKTIRCAQCGAVHPITSLERQETPT
jgi:ribosomal protein S27E